MAYIRDYAAAGDPFSLRLPKKLRKMKPLKALKRITLKKVGRAVGGIARFAAPFIPGIGGTIAQQLAPQQAAAAVEPEPAPMLVPEEEPVYLPAPVMTAPSYYEEPDEYEEEPAMPPWLSLLMAYNPEFAAFARSYGMEAGDPAGSGKTSKRKRAAAGPKVKATAKRQVRAKKSQKAAARMQRPRPGKKGGGFGAGLKKLGGALAKRYTGKPPASYEWMTENLPWGGALEGIVPGGRRAGGGAGRRSMNPANVKALRRSLRRVEGFEKLVKRVEKQYPRLKRAVGHAPMPAARKGRRCA